MKFKNILATTFLCATLLSPTIGIIKTDNSKPTYNISAQSKEYINIIKSTPNTGKLFTISDSALANRMMLLLGKTKNEFNTNDLIEHEDYKVIETQVGTETKIIDEEEVEVPIYEYSANKTCLDLSNSNITNITELCQFVWPKTLTSIDLSKNNINNSHINDFVNFLNFSSDSPKITINNKSVSINSDISEYVTTLNLNLNNIDLKTVTADNLNNTKIIYGIQKFENVVYAKDPTNNTIMPSMYYLKPTDFSHLNISLSVNNVTKPLELDKVNLFSDFGYGDYKITVSKATNGNIANISEALEQSYLNVYIKNTFSIERKSLFDISTNDIVIEGLTEGYTITPGKASTKDTGLNHVKITFNTNTKSWTSTLTFTVKDTKAPTLQLKGGETIYLQANGTNYVEYGCIGLDSEDDISHNVKASGKVDITTPGTYFITYTLSDNYGNNATPITRKVVVQEYALNKVLIELTNDKYYTNEEIILTGCLPSGTNLSKYKSLKYTWYYNDQEFITTIGDDITGTSSTSLMESKASKVKIHVVLTATLQDGSTESYTSEVLTLNIENKGAKISTTTISLLIALGIVIGSMFAVIYIRKRKSLQQKSTKKSPTKKTTTKTKKVIKDKKDKAKYKSKGAYDNYDEIQVIKNYGTNNDDPPSTMQY